MKHSKTLALLVVLLLGIFSSDSQSALAIFDKYKKLSSLSANFEQEKEISSLGVKLNSSGTLHFVKPDVFEWDVTKPKSFGFHFKKNVIELRQNGEAIKNADLSKLDPKMLGAISHMKAWLTMDTAFIEANYSIVEVSQTTFEFTPKGDSKLFKKIILETSDQNPVKRMDLFELSGDVIHITFTGTKLVYEK